MVFKFFQNLKNSESGITLIEIVVVVVIIVIFSMILIADFPEIQRQFALSRTTYKLAQDLRKTQDLALSSVKITLGNGTMLVSGYGIYVNPSQGNGNEYVIYADVDGSQTYNPSNSNPSQNLCKDLSQTTLTPITSDCVIEIIYINSYGSDTYIEAFTDETLINKITYSGESINFTPPNPTTTITEDGQDYTETATEIIFGSKKNPEENRRVLVNTSGLIEVK